MIVKIFVKKSFAFNINSIVSLKCIFYNFHIMMEVYIVFVIVFETLRIH